MPHKYSHDMNAPSIIINTNGVYIKASIRVNYTRDLACFLFLVYNIVKNNCSFTSDVKQFYANELVSNLLENKRKRKKEI